MSDQLTPYVADAKPQTVYVEKWMRFILIDGKWDVQWWPDRVTVSGKLYRVRIPVPPELIGDAIQASIEPIEPVEPAP